MERLYWLVGILIEDKQRLDRCEGRYNFLEIYTDEFGDPRWWKGADKQDDGTNGKPDLGIKLWVFLAEGYLEDRCVQ